MLKIKSHTVKRCWGLKNKMEKEEEIRELKENLKQGQDGSPLQEISNQSMRTRLKELEGLKVTAKPLQ